MYCLPAGETDVDRDGRDEVDTPCGGYMQSGVGRENGALGFEEYLEIKVIALPRRERRLDRTG
ncbi:MAG: aldehyde dehydrogenase family protein [Deltaproteobacteria bacterium]|nr:aldehyde dehydrogenase family protein [Deltaproteobacteria bacterium]